MLIENSMSWDLNFMILKIKKKITFSEAKKNTRYNLII